MTCGSGSRTRDKMTLVDRKTGVLGRSVDAGAYGTSGLGDLWFASDHSTTIERVDPASGSVKATIEGKGEDNCSITGEFPDNVWLSCFGRDVRSRSATRIDPATNTVAAVATVPPSHGGSVAIIDGEPWFVGLFDDDERNPAGGLLRMDPATGAVERFVSIGPADPADSVVASGGDLGPGRGRSSHSPGERRRSFGLTYAGGHRRSPALRARAPGCSTVSPSPGDCGLVSACRNRTLREGSVSFVRCNAWGPGPMSSDPPRRSTGECRRESQRLHVEDQPMSKLSACLWYDTQAEEAAEFYTKLLPDSHIDKVSRAAADTPSGKKGDVLTVNFTLRGQPFVGLNGGPDFKFNEAVSFVIDCEDQAEVDRYWDALIEGGGEHGPCGWLKDRYGLSWQVVPKQLYEVLEGPDPAGAQRAMEAMLQMGKLNVAELEAAYAGKEPSLATSR